MMKTMRIKNEEHDVHDVPKLLMKIMRIKKMAGREMCKRLGKKNVMIDNEGGWWSQL